MAFWLLIFSTAISVMGSGFKMIIFTHEEDNSHHLVQQFFRSKVVNMKDLVPKLRRRDDFAQSRRVQQGRADYDRGGSLSSVVDWDEYGEDHLRESESSGDGESVGVERPHLADLQTGFTDRSPTSCDRLRLPLKASKTFPVVMEDATKS
eukprot:CAMPEP_0115016434 /NCGR_PEP_ID=MMETSP0216-20121206/27439_1 /TAXON_ID=223996 /ORGANISM="Protocruzia adherens, Strain Boccale" /LENGTH=149 /DNA_ID=CAMNT_0002386899 /DNA_START=723 /DNA_END=1173 /DNA_ORIENTATION=-